VRWGLIVLCRSCFAGPGIGYRFASETLALKEQWIAAFRSFAPASRQSVNTSSTLASATTSGAVDLRAEGMNELVSTEKAYLQNLYSTIEVRDLPTSASPTCRR
jgi:hypothetical protein